MPRPSATGTLEACPSRSSPRSTRAGRTSRPPPWGRCSPGSPARRSSSPRPIRSTSPSTTCTPSTPAPCGWTTERALRRVAAAVEAAGVPVTTTVVAADGSPARALHEFAEDADAKLLVLGSSARGPIGRLLPGAVTDRLLHGAPCPVAVAPVGFSFEDAAAGPGLIGVAFTDTPDGHAALAMARALAGRARRARARVDGRAAARPARDRLADRQPAGGRAPCSPRGGGSRRAPRDRRAARRPVRRRPDPLGPSRRRAGRRRPKTLGCSCAARAATARCARCCSAGRPTRSCARRPARCSSCRPARPEHDASRDPSSGRTVAA